MYALNHKNKDMPWYKRWQFWASFAVVAIVIVTATQDLTQLWQGAVNYSPYGYADRYNNTYNNNNYGNPYNGGVNYGQPNYGYGTLTFGARFHDVEPDYQYRDAVFALNQVGVIDGYPDGSFRPHQSINRAEFTKVLYNSATNVPGGGYLPGPPYGDAELYNRYNSPYAGGYQTLPAYGDPYGQQQYFPDNSSGITRACFNDVGPQEWYTSYVCQAASFRWIEGYPDGSFRPAQTVNRAEALKMTLIAHRVPVNLAVVPSRFADVAPHDWFAPYVAAADQLGILDPADNFFNPGELMSRGEVVGLVYNIMLKQNPGLLPGPIPPRVLPLIPSGANFELELETDPEYEDVQDDDTVGVINDIEIGDTVKFTRSIEQAGVTAIAETWHYDDDHIDCDQKANGARLECEFEDEGGYVIYVSERVTFFDGSTQTFESKRITVNVEEEVEEEEDTTAANARDQLRIGLLASFQAAIEAYAADKEEYPTESFCLSNVDGNNPASIDGEEYTVEQFIADYFRAVEFEEVEPQAVTCNDSVYYYAAGDDDEFNYAVLVPVELLENGNFGQDGRSLGAALGDLSNNGGQYFVSKVTNFN